VSRFTGVTPTAASPLVHRLRVRYVECDMQGIVFNAHYYTWMDIAHTELVRAVLGPLDVLHGLGVDVVVAESSARYWSSARFDDEIDIEVRLTSLTTTSMTTVHTFRRGETPLAEGTVRHVCVDQQPWTKTPWPDDVRAAFAPLLPAG
jgi:acyl-CoA thioester hydrolase